MIEYLGPVLVLISWVTIGYILKKWRGTNMMSISQHAASSRHSSLLLTALLSGGGLLFYYWLLAWFAPKLGLGNWFRATLTLAFAAQFIAGLVPDIEGVKRRIHRIAAYGMAYLFMPLSFMILTAPHISNFARWFGILCLTYLIGSLLLITLIPKSKKHYLVFQTIYVVAFQLQILVSAYAN